MTIAARIVIGIFYLALIIFAAYHLSRPEEKPEEIEYSEDLHDKIVSLYELDKEIQLVKDMMINLSTADYTMNGDELRTMEVVWDWGGKLGQQASFPVGKGTPTADAMRVLAEVRRDELIRKLSSEIRQLPYS